MGSDKDKDPKSTIRQIFERALTAGGLHVTKGAIIWEAYREFENVLVSMVRKILQIKRSFLKKMYVIKNQLIIPGDN